MYVAEELDKNVAFGYVFIVNEFNSAISWDVISLMLYAIRGLPHLVKIRTFKETFALLS